jgi:hypothetical protein
MQPAHIAQAMWEGSMADDPLDKKISVAVALTEHGVEAISTILDNAEESAFDRLVAHLHSKMPAIELREYVRNDGGNDYRLRRILPASDP